MSSPSEPNGLSRLGQIGISVHDLAAASRFYGDVLGLPRLFEMPTMAFFDLAGVRLMLAVPDHGQPVHPSSILYFKVDDIRAAHATLESRGVVFERAPTLVAKMPDHELWMAFFRDPERNLHALMSEVR
jgi:methylmalonyl-CoA/ethylmalonyl-CoA epimerase